MRVVLIRYRPAKKQYVWRKEAKAGSREVGRAKRMTKAVSFGIRFEKGKDWLSSTSLKIEVCSQAVSSKANRPETNRQNKRLSSLPTLEERGQAYNTAHSANRAAPPQGRCMRPRLRVVLVH